VKFNERKSNLYLWFSKTDKDTEKRRDGVPVYGPTADLLSSTQCVAVQPSSINAGNLCSGPRRYSTFTTIQPTSLQVKTTKYVGLFTVQI